MEYGFEPWHHVQSKSGHLCPSVNIIASLHPGVKMGTSESWGVTWDGLASSLSRGNRNIPGRAMPMKCDINTGLMSHIGSGQTLLWSKGTICFHQYKLPTSLSIDYKLMYLMHLFPQGLFGCLILTRKLFDPFLFSLFHHKPLWSYWNGGILNIFVFYCIVFLVRRATTLVYRFPQACELQWLSSLISIQGFNTRNKYTVIIIKSNLMWSSIL